MKMDEDEKELFLDYMKALKDTDYYDTFYTFFGDELFRFLDIFAGESVRVPKRGYISKVIKYVKIYRYCEARGFTEESFRKASKVFDKRKSSIVRAIDKVDRVLAKVEKDDEEVEEGEDGEEG